MVVIFSREKRGESAPVLHLESEVRGVCVRVCVEGAGKKGTLRCPSSPCTSQVLSKPPGASFLRHPLPFFPQLGSRSAVGAASESNILERGGSTTTPQKGKKDPP